MSYAERDFATVPAAPPAWKNQRTTSCPAPISAKVPYFASSRLTVRALRFVVNSSVDSIGHLGQNRYIHTKREIAICPAQCATGLTRFSPSFAESLTLANSAGSRGASTPP